MPAIAAMRFDPMADLATRLGARGKRAKQFIAAIMRRTLVLVYDALERTRNLVLDRVAAELLRLVETD